MNREKVISDLKHLLDTNTLLYVYERESLEYAIKKLERTAQEVPVQEQYVTLKIDGSDIAKVALNQIREMQRKSNITILPV